MESAAIQHPQSVAGEAVISAIGEQLRWAERLLTRMLRPVRKGQLMLTFPSGRQAVVSGPEDGPRCDVTIRSLKLLTRLMRAGELGIAESYMAGEWETDDLSALLRFGIQNETALADACRPSLPVRLTTRLLHALNANTRRGSRRNIAAHYDLGNTFYRLWLDETMTYSAALFDDMDEPLSAAQRRKYHRLAEKLDLSPGERVLEIGCGWGGFAEIAARDYGCNVVCLTLSQEQAAFAEERMAKAGLAGKVEIRVQDYRDVTGSFDKIASIEMFEAVGEAYWPVYLRTLRERLNPGGKAALQVITIDDDTFESYRRTPDFIQRYIFPGGMLPPPGRIADEIGAAGMQLAESFFFGASYAETLRRWDDAFKARWQTIRQFGFDDRFYRMWRYYLRYCEVGFDVGRIDVAHFVVERS